jgi:hypothetical protein
MCQISWVQALTILLNENSKQNIGTIDGCRW